MQLKFFMYNVPLYSWSMGATMLLAGVIIINFNYKRLKIQFLHTAVSKQSTTPHANQRKTKKGKLFIKNNHMEVLFKSNAISINLSIYIYRLKFFFPKKSVK